MRRTKALWAAVLLAGALVALTPLGVAAARADEGQPAPGMDLETPIEVDGSQAVASPFPDKISDEEIASMTKSNVLVSKEAIRKVEIELTSGEKILFPNNFAGEPAEAPSSVLPTDIVQRYNGNIRRITTYYVIPPGIDDYCIICVGDWITSGYRDDKLARPNNIDAEPMLNLPDGKETLVRSGLTSDDEGQVSGLTGVGDLTYDDLVALAKCQRSDRA